MPGSPSMWIISFTIITLWGSSYDHSHFADKETEAYRGWVGGSKYSGSRKREVFKPKKSSFKADIHNLIHGHPGKVSGCARIHGCKQQQQHWLIQSELRKEWAAHGISKRARRPGSQLCTSPQVFLQWRATPAQPTLPLGPGCNVNCALVEALGATAQKTLVALFLFQENVPHRACSFSLCLGIGRHMEQQSLAEFSSNHNWLTPCAALIWARNKCSCSKSLMADVGGRAVWAFVIAKLSDNMYPENYSTPVSAKQRKCINK